LRHDGLRSLVEPVTLPGGRSPKQSGESPFHRADLHVRHCVMSAVQPWTGSGGTASRGFGTAGWTIRVVFIRRTAQRRRRSPTSRDAYTS
jgi:hypothetical protein